MNASGSNPSHRAVTRQSQVSAVDEPNNRHKPTVRCATNASSSRESARSAGARKIRLIADQQYFGLDALALHIAAERVLARIAAQDPQRRWIDVRALSEDFRLDSAASGRLLTALVVEGLLESDGTGRYRPTALFREYARACVVAPLSRERAKTLIDRATEVAARINANWTRNPYLVQTVAVSGSYMSRRDPLKELSLWLVLCARPKTQARRVSLSLDKDQALRQIGAAMKALSSFVVVRVAADRQSVRRPFSVVFEASEEQIDFSPPAFEKLREWGISVSRRLVMK
ncbi:MAG TPA: hypothetical protein VGA51_19425 [Casimicrobiaceae bacterium]